MLRSEMEEPYSHHLPKSHPEPGGQVLIEEQFVLGLNLILTHSPGQSSRGSPDYSPANKEGCGKALLPGLFPLFYKHFHTVKWCENVMDS